MYKNSWEQGDEAITPEEAATAAKEMLNLYWQSVCGDVDTVVPAPYWDNEEDVDDSLPVEEQDWYGYVESATAPAGEMTFVQSAVIWILTGFVALVLSPTLPIGAAAAVTFRTLATRFTLAFNRGDIGEQFRVIIDASDYETIDTESLAVGDIVELNIDGLADTEFHDILIVRTVT